MRQDSLQPWRQFLLRVWGSAGYLENATSILYMAAPLVLSLFGLAPQRSIAVPIDVLVEITEVDTVDVDPSPLQGENDLYATLNINNTGAIYSSKIKNSNHVFPKDWHFRKRIDTDDIVGTRVPIDILIRDDDLFPNSDDVIDVSPKGKEINVLYDIQSRTLGGDVTSSPSIGSEGSVHFNVSSYGVSEYKQDILFETSNQSLWGSGGAAVLDDWDYFLGPRWSKSGSAGKVHKKTLVPGGCLPGWLGGGCWDPVTSSLGAEIRGSTNGEVGIDLYADWDTGSVNVNYPVGVSLEYPDPWTVKPGELFSISSSYVTDSAASLNTNFPEAHIRADAVFDVFADAGGKVCLAGCLGGHFTLFDVNKRLNLLDISSNASFEANLPAGTGSIRAAIPDIDTVGILDNRALSSSGSNTFLDLDIDLDRVVTNLLALPPLGASVNALGTTFSYNVLDVSAGVALDISQNFLFQPDLKVELDLLGKKETFSVGESIELTMPNYTFDIKPTFMLDNQFFNETTLDIIPDLSLSALSVSAAGASFGPVFEERISSTIPITLFDDSFALNGFQAVSTRSFKVIPAPEPSVIMLSLVGLLSLAISKSSSKC